MLSASLTRLLPLAKLRPGKNPRGKKFKVDDLVESFDHAPLLQNIVARRIPGPRDEYEIVSGHRRFEAAKRKGWSHIEAKIVDVEDEKALAYALEENLRRKALPDETTAIAQLFEIYNREGATKQGGDRKSKAFLAQRVSAAKDRVLIESAAARAARVTGQSEAEVRLKARIGRRSAPVVKKALANKRIGILEADKLGRLPAREQPKALMALLDQKTRPDVPREVRKALDALAYVGKVLGDRNHAAFSRSHLTELRQRLDEITALLDRSGRPGSAGRRASRLKVVSAQPEAGTKVSEAVRFEPISMNRKLSEVGLASGKKRPHFTPMRPYVCSTLVSIQASCPDTRAFKGTPTSPGGCYVDAGFTRIAMQKLDSAAWGLSSFDVIREEVRQIDDAFGGGPIPQDGARGGRDLRLHVGGDVDAAAGAQLLAKAARRWRARGGGTVWTYTHSWRAVPRSAWGDAITVLASVEKPSEIEQARKKGYAAAVVVEDFPSEKAFTTDGAKVKVVPCPAETRRTTCADCRLCLDRDLVQMNVAIAFKLHGQHEAAARRALNGKRGN
jgi:ParB/RepB/Spo0J family partition protein